ncbi:MoaD/ThiS family protein [Chloroflexota bacterium]
MSVKINLSTILSKYTSGQAVAEADGATVGQCLDQLIERFPPLKEGLFDTVGKLHSYLDIYVNGKSAFPEELGKPVKDKDELRIVFLIAGG